MPEVTYGLTSSAAKLLRQVGDKHRQRLPDVGRRTRRVPAPSTSAVIVVIQSATDPGKAGTGRVQRITNTPPIAAGDTIYIANKSPIKDIVVINFRPNRLAAGVAYLAHQVGNQWVVENDACFQDFLT